MARSLCLVATLLAMMFVSNPSAIARDIPPDGFTYDDVVSWLQDKGLEAKITTDALDHKIVSTTVNGVRFGVYFFDCQNGKCGSIQFAAGWPTEGKIDNKQVNEWNRTKRWSRAYLDNSGGIWLEADWDITPGGTYELLDDEYATWKKTVEAFVVFFKMK
jgi:hypothetical protein